MLLVLFMLLTHLRLIGHRTLHARCTHTCRQPPPAARVLSTFVWWLALCVHGSLYSELRSAHFYIVCVCDRTVSRISVRDRPEHIMLKADRADFRFFESINIRYYV